MIVLECFLYCNWDHSREGKYCIVVAIGQLRKKLLILRLPKSQQKAILQITLEVYKEWKPIEFHRLLKD